MAMQTGFGLSRIVILAGAGYGGTIMLKNGKLAELLGELQQLLKKREKGGESDGEDAIAAQVRRLAMEVRNMASARPITILNGGPGQNGYASLVLSAAALGTLGYGYMWWKGISFSDLMYVTKRNMANAVANLTKYLEHVSDALAATKKHLTQRIENFDGKVDDQIKILKELKSEVSDTSDDVSQIKWKLNDLRMMVSGVDGRLYSLEAKQDFANHGLAALYAFLSGKPLEQPLQVDDKFKGQFKLTGCSVPTLMGLKEFADAVDRVENNNRLITDCIFGDGNDRSNDICIRTPSRKS